MRCAGAHLMSTTWTTAQSGSAPVLALRVLACLTACLTTCRVQESLRRACGWLACASWLCEVQAPLGLALWEFAIVVCTDSLLWRQACGRVLACKLPTRPGVCPVKLMQVLSCSSAVDHQLHFSKFIILSQVLFWA